MAFSKGEREYAAYLSDQVCYASANNIVNLVCLCLCLQFSYL